MTPHKHNETGDPPCTDGFSARHSSTLSLRRTDDAFPATNCPQASWQALHTPGKETCCLFPGIAAGGIPSPPGSRVEGLSDPRAASPLPQCPSALLSHGSAPGPLCWPCGMSVLHWASAESRRTLGGYKHGQGAGSWVSQATMWEGNSSPTPGALSVLPPPPTPISFCVETRLQSVHTATLMGFAPCEFSFHNTCWAAVYTGSCLQSLILSIP